MYNTKKKWKRETLRKVKENKRANGKGWHGETLSSTILPKATCRLYDVHSETTTTTNNTSHSPCYYETTR